MAVAIGAGVAVAGVGAAAVVLTNPNAEEDDGEASLDSEGNPKPRKTGFRGSLMKGFTFLEGEAGGFIKENGINQLLGDDLGGAFLDQAAVSEESQAKEEEKKAAIERGEIIEEESKPKEKLGFFSTIKKGGNMLVQGTLDAAKGNLQEYGLANVLGDDLTEKVMGKKEQVDAELEQKKEEKDEEEEGDDKKQSENDSDKGRTLPPPTLSPPPSWEETLRKGQR